MQEPAHSEPSLYGAFRDWWRDGVSRYGVWATLKTLVAEISYFARESTPARKRQRYGDVDYDWEKRVDTTSATVSVRTRLLGTFHSLYQATQPDAFDRMMASLPIEFPQFTFIDLGSGKGRTLLMASEYPFAKILGVELFPELHNIAQENIHKYRSDSQKCFEVNSLATNAKDFEFPREPMVLYLFNPFPLATLEQVMVNLERSLQNYPRTVYLIYHNPLLEAVLANSSFLKRVGVAEQFVIYAHQPGVR